MNQRITVVPEISAETGIRQIRQVIGHWFAENLSADEAMARVTSLIVQTRLDVIEVVASNTPA